MALKTATLSGSTDGILIITNKAMNLDISQFTQTIRDADEFAALHLSAHRVLHIRDVAIESRRLAIRYGYDTRKAYLAGYLHDCAKGFSKDENEKYIVKYGIEVTEDEMSLGNNLVHSKVGAFFAKEHFGVDDPEIFDAIYYHTVGRPGMTLLEKIIYTADYIEPGRDMNSAVPLKQVRTLAYEDLDRAVYEITFSIVEYLKTLKDTYICPESLKTFEFYDKVINRRKEKRSIHGIQRTFKSN